MKRYFAILIDLKRRGHTSCTTASHEPREAALGLQVAEEVRGKVGESLCCNLQVKERADGVSRLRICWFA